MTHTPGPWYIPDHCADSDSVSVWTGVEQPKQLAKGICLLHATTSRHRSELMANAKLISAAPDLFDALFDLISLEIKGHTLMSRLQFSSEGRALSKKITDAISKAKGF